MAQMLEVCGALHARHKTLEVLDVKFLVLLDVPVSDVTTTQSMLRMLHGDELDVLPITQLIIRDPRATGHKNNPKAKD